LKFLGAVKLTRALVPHMQARKYGRIVNMIGMFEYIEMSYNSKRKDVRNGMLSPVNFERQRKTATEGAYDSWGIQGHDRCLS
jgi:NAD(P)-dependent dehydrogenase (short-subunit alcohol dehydrogenase family)